MSKEKKSDSTDTSTRQTDSAKGTSLTEIQQKVDIEQSQGFRGTEVDSTPNENYTVAGVTSGAPTPETDVEAAKSAREDTGLGLSALEASAKEKASGGKK